MSHSTCGTCSICGGRVSVPSYWHCIYPPVPTCERCGATAREHGPVIDMEPRKPFTFTTTTPETTFRQDVKITWRG